MIIPDRWDWVVFNYDWGKQGSCPNGDRGVHHAYLVVSEQVEYEHLRQQHKDDKHKLYWSHMEFTSVGCELCGKQSPIRAGHSMSSYPVGYKRPHIGGNIINYAPTDEFPEICDHVVSEGWSYTFFKETLSDSLFGQETFTISKKEYEKIKKARGW